MCSIRRLQCSSLEEKVTCTTLRKEKGLELLRNVRGSAIHVERSRRLSFAEIIAALDIPCLEALE